jgi:VWFA-related protein
MKTKNSLFYRSRIFPCIVLLLLGLIAISQGQDNSSSNPDFRIQVSVEEVRIDAVVLKKGKQVTNLTAKNFEVYQDGQLVQIASCKYVNDQLTPAAQPGAAQPGVVKPKDSRKLPPIPMAKLTREGVRRAVIFIVDDISMDFTNLNHARMGLRKFAEAQMQQGDLIAILRTSYGKSANQVFTSDKRELLARIEAVEWGPSAGRALSEDELNPVYESQSSTINYAIRALKDMPGRKELVVITAQPQLGGGVAGSPADTFTYESRYKAQFDRLADEALRAGVVIHLLDIRGVEVEDMTSFAASNSSGASNSSETSSSPVSLTPMMTSSMSGALGMSGMSGMMGGGSNSSGSSSGTSGNSEYRPLSPQGPARINSNGGMSVGSISSVNSSGGMGGGGMPMGPGMFSRGYTPGRNTQRLISAPEKTGGFFIQNKNFFLNGLGGVEEHLKGYYLLSYVPAPNTFAASTNEAKYHRISVLVNQKGVEVHTRDGFLGVSATQEQASNEVPNALRDAIFSPFQNSDLKLSLSSGYVSFPQKGYMIRAWVHLEGKNLEIIKKAEGNIISLKTVCLATDVNGNIREANYRKLELSVKDENIAWIRENGLRFSLLLSIKKPGAYYLRTLVEDQTTQRIGSAYEFITIPDLNKGRLAMSNLFVTSSKEDRSWVWSGVSVNEKDQQVLIPVLQKDETKFPALRNYNPGDDLDYMAVIYNAGRKQTPDLESQFFLYREGVELMKGEPQPVDVAGVTDFTRIPIRKIMKLGKEMQEGNYVLQLVIRDKQDTGKNGVVAQALNFAVKSN